MSPVTPDMPVVFQQASRVATIQESVQRAGEMQTLAAASEDLRQRAADGQRVTRHQETAADNKVGERRQGGRAFLRRKRAAKEPAPTASPADPEEGGGLFDVVV